MFRQLSVSDRDIMTLLCDVSHDIGVYINIKLSSEMVNDLINVANKVIYKGLIVNRLDDFLSAPATSMLRVII
ncbi:hypothetical protein AWJ07_20440 [Shewanella frigidimarina]|uniref:Uncharacterized protein n=1 Tax=Shewanella frigidimarina TaxID=56812 RepID=A0A106BXL3_SHEFR|nr:hypothetical protein AWJ07_20440 [Shewanella frigidimarina]